MTQNDTALLNKVKVGDTQAFDELIKQYVPKLKTLLAHQYRIQDCDLDDVIQVASNKAWTKIHSFRGDCQFLTWLYTIVRNEAINFLKKRRTIDKHEVMAHSDNVESNDGDYEHILKCSIDKQLNDNALAMLEKREMLELYREILEDVLGQLSPVHRQIIKMVLEDEMTYQEIAEILNIPIGTVMSRLFFARKNAQKLIRDYAAKNELALSCIK
jgi:RNA polymerase sigma-70 factor, ECF subfamily